ncbi:MAG: Rhodanese-related sulfurtransferase [Chthonomonadaceae bacterium]|nr:Rhodanese-related sulfurtransferase [Chthonomonadaceae bacterium]
MLGEKMTQETKLRMWTPQEVQARREAEPDLLLLDVRTEGEWNAYHIPGATLLPMQVITSRLEELDPQRETIVMCEHGVRSMRVARFLVEQAGFENVGNMLGGMSEWEGPVERG